MKSIFVIVAAMLFAFAFAEEEAPAAEVEYGGNGIGVAYGGAAAHLLVNTEILNKDIVENKPINARVTVFNVGARFVPLLTVF